MLPDAAVYNARVTLLQRLVDTSQRVGAGAARKHKIRELAEFIRSLEPAEIATAVHYLSGEISQGRIGIGYSTLKDATVDGAAATPALSISDVDGALTAIEEARGSGSSARRGALLRGLFARATAAEQEFLLRLVVGELRQGALAGVMLDAIAAAAELPIAAIRRAAMYAKDLGTLARTALAEGTSGLARFQLALFSPISPMLAQTATDVGEALGALAGDVVFEWKMDGARIQLHKAAGEVRIYTRSLNDVTVAVPEIVEAAAQFPGDTVLDGEAIAFDAAERPLPFQVTMRRFGRKLNVDALRRELPIRGYFFDCLYANGRSIADLSLRERHAALAGTVPAAMLFPRLVTADESAARVFYETAVSTGHEGVMAKSLDSVYEAGNRGASWLKIKRAHTLDLVVLAAEWGHGRRTGLLSNLHLGALDQATGEYVMLGKTFKGLTDAMLTWQTAQLLKREVRRDRGTVYVRPELVVEVAFSDLQASVRYSGGLALRLARVKRYRDDKGVADADGMDSVRKIFAGQTASATGVNG